MEWHLLTISNFDIDGPFVELSFKRETLNPESRLLPLINLLYVERKIYSLHLYNSYI